jgi:hypothetical protein
LYRAIYKASLERGVEHWISIVDDKVYKMLKEHFGIPFEELGGAAPGPYLGSELSHAVDAFVPDFYDKMSGRLSSNNNRLGRMIFGILVEGVADKSILIDDAIK